jgi:hypothetical protein
MSNKEIFPDPLRDRSELVAGQEYSNMSDLRAYMDERKCSWSGNSIFYHELGIL